MVKSKNIIEPKVVLINPPLLRKGYGVFAEAGGRNAPLGILYLASVLEKNNIKVNIIDAEGENLQIPNIIGRLKKLKPNIIGISSTTSAFNKALFTSKKIKEIYPKIKIVIGGPHITAEPTKTMKNEVFDFGIIGEGEYPFLELINTLKFNKEYKNIKSLVYKKNEKIIINPRRELIKDLDSIPFPSTHLLKNYKEYTPQLTAYRKKPVGTIITSRGCPFQCIFCDRNTFGNRFRSRSPENILKEIKFLIKKYGIKEIKFLDDTFTIDKNRVIKLCNLLISNKINLIWSCSLRADCIDEELLKKMKEAGCWCVSLGIESGNEEILKFIKKGLKKSNIIKCVNLAKKVGIKTRGFFMIGHPKDTKETIRETIEFAKELPLHIAEFSLTTPFPNTILDKISKEYGTINEGDLSKFSLQFPVFVPKGLSKEYLIKMHRLARKEFYLRPSKIIEYILDIRGFNDIKRYLVGFKILIKSLLHN